MAGKPTLTTEPSTKASPEARIVVSRTMRGRSARFEDDGREVMRVLPQKTRG
jgi:hypothetical protein